MFADVGFSRVRIDAHPSRMHPASVSKPKKAVTSPREKLTPGTIMAAEVRARANTLSDTERESLMAHAMRTIYGEKSGAAAHAHRR